MRTRNSNILRDVSPQVCWKMEYHVTSWPVWLVGSWRLPCRVLLISLKQGNLSTRAQRQKVTKSFQVTCDISLGILSSRIQNMRIINGKPEYTGMVDVISRVVKNEGVFSLWKGFTPYYMRIGILFILTDISQIVILSYSITVTLFFPGPHTVLTFIFLEQMTKLYREHMF